MLKPSRLNKSHTNLGRRHICNTSNHRTIVALGVVSHIYIQKCAFEWWQVKRVIRKKNGFVHSMCTWDASPAKCTCCNPVGWIPASRRLFGFSVSVFFSRFYFGRCSLTFACPRRCRNVTVKIKCLQSNKAVCYFIEILLPFAFMPSVCVYSMDLFVLWVSLVCHCVLRFRPLFQFFEWDRFSCFY